MGNKVEKLQQPMMSYRSPKDLLEYPIIAEITTQSQPTINKWLYISFTVNKEEHNYRKCLATSNLAIDLQDRYWPNKNVYRDFYLSLSDICQQGSECKLLQDIHTQCKVSPTHEDFSLIYQAMVECIQAHISTINFNSIRHR